MYVLKQRTKLEMNREKQGRIPKRDIKLRRASTHGIGMLVPILHAHFGLMETSTPGIIFISRSKFLTLTYCCPFGHCHNSKMMQAAYPTEPSCFTFSASNSAVVVVSCWNDIIFTLTTFMRTWYVQYRCFIWQNLFLGLIVKVSGLADIQTWIANPQNQSINRRIRQCFAHVCVRDWRVLL